MNVEGVNVQEDGKKEGNEDKLSLYCGDCRHVDTEKSLKTRTTIGACCVVTVNKGYN